jgi:hypothetical protein
MEGALYPFDPEMPHKTRADRQIKLLKAGVLGEPGAIAPATPDVQEIYFDVIARSARTGSLDEPMTVQWDFTDADPWHVRLNNGSSTAEKGLAPDADITLETTWGQWIQISMQGENPLKAVATRRLRPRGGLRNLARMGQVWQPRA